MEISTSQSSRITYGEDDDGGDDDDDDDDDDRLGLGSGYLLFFVISRVEARVGGCDR